MYIFTHLAPNEPQKPLPRIASGKFGKRKLQQHAIDWLEAAKAGVR